MDSLMHFLTWEMSAGPIHVVVWELLYIATMFLVLSAILNKLLFQPVMAILDERARRVAAGTGAQDESTRLLDEKARTLAERLNAARREMANRVDAAKHEAEARRQAEVGEARRKAEQRVTIVRATIQKGAADADVELRKSAEQLAGRMASRLLGREVA